MIQIRAIVAYSHDGRHRVLPLEPGKVNIISGDSRTGKSAILGVIDYCFGSSALDVPEGIVRRGAGWFGLLLQTTHGQAFIARKLPVGNGKSNEAVFIKIGQSLDIPQSAELRQTTNTDGLAAMLASWVGITDYLHEPPAGHSRPPLSATFNHALTFCFQSQNEIGQKGVLFHGASDRFVAQAIKDTLPYFLGAVTDEYIRNQQLLKQVRAEIRQLEKRLAEASAIVGDGVSRADTLLAEAKSVGLSDLADDASWADKVEVLKRIQNSPIAPPVAEGDDQGEFHRLTQKRTELLQAQRAIQVAIDRARAFEGNSRGFAKEAAEHVARLGAISVFEPSAQGHACPLCLQDLPAASAAPSIDELRAAKDNIGERGGAMDSATPRIESAIVEIEEKLIENRRDLETNRELLGSIKRSSKRLQLASDTEARQALVVGRISLYVENIPEMPDVSEQRNKLAKLREQELELYEAVSADAIQERLESCLSNVNRSLSDYAERVDLEYSDSPLRLDPRALTIVADTPNRPIPMREIGSGENHVGYHIVAHLALHKWFAERKRPVPSFLLLDQLSQAHFSPDAVQRENVDPSKIDTDRKAVKALYRLIFDVIEEEEGRFQVIITDHPDFSDDPRFQAAVRERWRNGVKLIPQDWPLLS
jgi:hypothetical protein